MNRIFDELITKACVRRIRFHDLRHTCASLLLAQNVPARVVMEILGHSQQLAITTDLYSHVMPSALRAAADAIDASLLAELNCVAVTGPISATLATKLSLA